MPEIREYIFIGKDYEIIVKLISRNKKIIQNITNVIQIKSCQVLFYSKLN